MYTIYFLLWKERGLNINHSMIGLLDLIFIKENVVNKIAIYLVFKMVHCCVFLKKDRTIFNHYQILSFQKSI